MPKQPREIVRTAFGERMFQARKRAKLTQQQAATRSGVAQSTIADLEKTGQGSAHTVTFALIYGCDAAWLANETGDPNWRKPGSKFKDAPPEPPSDFSDRHSLTDSEWSTWEALTTMLPPDVVADAKRRHARFKDEVEREITERMKRTAKDD